MFNRFWNWLNTPRVLEVTYKTIKDEVKPMFKVEETKKNKIENLRLTVDFYDALRKKRIANYENTLRLVKNFIKRKSENDGLLLTNRQLEEDAKETVMMYARMGLIDDFNNLKPAALEVLEV